MHYHILQLNENGLADVPRPKAVFSDELRSEVNSAVPSMILFRSPLYAMQVYSPGPRTHSPSDPVSLPQLAQA